MTARTLDEWRAVDAPFALNDWEPIPGTCSRCGGREWLGQNRWWQVLPPLPPRGMPAEFVPDRPGRC